MTEGHSHVAEAATLLGRWEGDRLGLPCAPSCPMVYSSVQMVWTRRRGGDRPPALISAKVAGMLGFVCTAIVAAVLVFVRCAAVAKGRKRPRYMW